MSMSSKAIERNRGEVRPVSVTSAARRSAPRVDDTPGYLARQLGAALTRARQAAGKSQRAAARDLNIAGNTLRELELGEANPTLARIEDLAGKLGLTVELKVRKRGRR